MAFRKMLYFQCTWNQWPQLRSIKLLWAWNLRSMGPDGMPSEVLKHCSAVLSKHLANLINESFSEGCFPNCLKLANVVPVYKSDENTDMSNYRPISLLSVVSKVFEKAMYTRIVSFLHQFKLLGTFSLVSEIKDLPSMRLPTSSRKLECIIRK